MPVELTTDNDEVPTASVWVWIGLTVIAAISFWCQATVTEERFVPALNVLSTAFDIPDDVAGATLMAAGASSPELFSSIVALFITHSALGLGTIVGSEIFNQLIICAGAVFAAKSGKLELDRAISCMPWAFFCYTWPCKTSVPSKGMSKSTSSFHFPMLAWSLWDTLPMFWCAPTWTRSWLSLRGHPRLLRQMSKALSLTTDPCINTLHRLPCIWKKYPF